MTEGIKCLAASNAFHCVFFQAIGQNNLTFEMLLSDVSHNKKASLILQKKKNEKPKFVTCLMNNSI